jgi:hypothetical protein
MSKIPYRINEINIDNICYTDIKTNSKKTIIYLKYMDNSKLKNIVFQTPNLFNVYNIVKKTDNNMYELDLPLKGKSDTKMTKFIRFLNDIDRKIIKDAKNNSSWFAGFPQQKTMKYQKIIRESTEPEYANGIIRLKILKTNDFSTIVHLNNKKLESFDNNIPVDCWVKSILEIYAIWINENGFGLFIRPILMDFKLSDSLLYNYKLIDDSEDGDDIDDSLCTVHNNSKNDSVFIRSENDMETSILDVQDFSELKRELSITDIKNTTLIESSSNNESDENDGYGTTSE